MPTTFREVGLATFLTSLTTSVGFFTLTTASITPIREFGIYTGIGVFIAFIVAFTLLPSSLMLLPKPKISKKSVNASRWFGVLSRSFLLVLRYRKPVILINVLLIAGSLYGISQIVINTYLIEDLPSDDPLKEGFTFFDQNFGGSRPFEVSVEVKDTTLNIYSPEIIQEIEKVESYMKSDFAAGNVASPVTLVKSMHQALNGGANKAFSLPDSERNWRRLDRYLNRILKRDDQNQVSTKDRRIGRITARVGDIGSSLSLQRTEELKEFIAINTDIEKVSFVVTGTSNLIDKNNEYLAKNMFQGLGIAFGVVALIAGLMFKSVKMVFITLIPNIIPLLIVAGVMGIFGVTLKLSTSIIFTIAFGIAVDDTIHFISKLKLELLKNKSLIYALKRTYLSTGKAIVVTSIILSGGFLILILSSFGGTFYTGLLISLTLGLALVVDLTLLPVFVLLFYKR
ncbi:MAG: MMPL family transporter [Bacteroidota bacterium]